MKNRVDLTTTADVVRLLGAIYHGDIDQEILAALRSCDLSDLAKTIVFEKSVFLTLSHLRDLDSVLWQSVIHEEPLASRLRFLENAVNSIPAVCDLLTQIAADERIVIWMMKGLAAQRWYPDLRMRDLGDIDLMLSSVDDGFALASALLSRGYTYDHNELPWLKASSSGVVYGQINLRQSEVEAPSIDIHFGGYSVRHCGLLPLPSTNSPPRLNEMDGTTTVKQIIVNAAGDQLISLKDLNDIALSLNDLSVSWPDVILGLREVCLDGYLCSILKSVRRFQCLDSTQASKVDSLIAKCKPELVPPVSSRYWQPTHWRMRWLATTVHAFRLGRRRSMSEGVRLGVSAARYYRRHLNLFVSPTARGLKVNQLNAWQCVRLVPLDLAFSLLGGEVTLREPFNREARVDHPISKLVSVVCMENGDLVLSPDAIFLPTVDYQLSLSLLRELV